MSDAKAVYPEERFSPEPSLELAFEAHVLVDPPLMLGEVDGRQRRIVADPWRPGRGREAAGEKVLAGGADWQAIRPNGVTEVLARYVIRADDGAMISVVNQGIRRASEPVIRRLLAGEAVDPALVYFRAAPTFEVGPGPHAWLTEQLFVSAGVRRPDSVHIRFYMVRFRTGGPVLSAFAACPLRELKVCPWPIRSSSPPSSFSASGPSGSPGPLVQAVKSGVCKSTPDGPCATRSGLPWRRRPAALGTNGLLLLRAAA